MSNINSNDIDDYKGGEMCYCPKCEQATRQKLLTQTQIEFLNLLRPDAVDYIFEQRNKEREQ